MSTVSAYDAINQISDYIDVMKSATCNDSKAGFKAEDVDLEEMQVEFGISAEMGAVARQLVGDLMSMRESLLKKAREDSTFRPESGFHDDWGFEMSISHQTERALASLKVRTEVYRPYWFFSGTLEDTKGEYEKEIKSLREEIGYMKSDHGVEKERLECKVISLEEENEKLETNVAELEKGNEKLETNIAELEKESGKLEDRVAELEYELDNQAPFL